MARKGSKKPNLIKTTLLIVGEGADDKAFITHLKNLYCPRGCGVTVKVEAGDGGSPGNIITNAIRSFESADYSKRIIILDADVPPSQAEIAKARKNGYEILLWEPKCLEGVLLEVLGERVGQHENSQQLKDRLHPKLKGHHTDYRAYEVLFSKLVLMQAGNASIKAVLQMFG